MRIHYPKLRNMTHALSLSGFIAFKETNFYILFAITAGGVVPCGCPKSLPVHHQQCRIYFTLVLCDQQEYS